MARIAAVPIRALGADPIALDERDLIALASTLSRSAQPDAARDRAARAVHAAMDFDEGFRGLRGKICRPEFPFVDEMNWIIARVL